MGIELNVQAWNLVDKEEWNEYDDKGMLFLGSIICKLGYNVLIPRIPPLKELKIKSDYLNGLPRIDAQKEIYKLLQEALKC